MALPKELLEQLTPEQEKEVQDFAQFLIEKKGRVKGKKVGQSWAGAMRKYRDQYTSLELQKKALEWRGD